MSAARKNDDDAFWNNLMDLANQDESVIQQAIAHATDPKTGRVRLKSVTRRILEQTNPALLATMDAAQEFARAVNYKDGIRNLPHLQRVYNLAARDPLLPRAIFKEAVQSFAPDTKAPLCSIIEPIVARHEFRLSVH
ncbi:MAG: hypothetical protein HYU57_08665 [Micavibrio aeruginosavorus]|nr:hypothetical protein [Micavibrio aeruginosavorus]